MNQSRIKFTVYTKPWKIPLPELAEFVKRLGFDGVEMPIAPGFQVEPDNVMEGLPEAVRILGSFGLKITVTGPSNEKIIAACGECGVPLIRTCVGIPKGVNYLTAIADFQRETDQLIPLLDRHGVALGVQNHCDRYIANAMQIRHAVEKYDPKHVCAVWDAAHNGLQGEDVDIALDTVWPHLRMVNLKSAYWKLVSPPEAEIAQWETYWTTGRHGRANWPWVARELKARGFAGDICLTAEYSDHQAVDRLIAEDIQFAKSLFC